MRKWTIVVLLMCLMACLWGCAGETQVPPGLEFQGIPWNSSPETVFGALDSETAVLSQRETHEDALGSYFVVTARDWKVFGETAVNAYFRFYNFTPDKGDHFGLSSIQIFYPEDCDQEAVLSNLRACYGPEAREYTLYSVVEGQPQPRQYAWEAGNFSWFSQQLAGDVLSDSGRAAYRSMLGEISDEGFEACLAAPAARILWVEDYYGQFESPEALTTEPGRVAWLNMNGFTLAYLLQVFEGGQ